jgi:hypothetical protein
LVCVCLYISRRGSLIPHLYQTSCGLIRGSWFEFNSFIRIIIYISTKLFVLNQLPHPKGCAYQTQNKPTKTKPNYSYHRIAEAAKPPSRQAAKLPSRQAAKPPSCLAA